MAEIDREKVIRLIEEEIRVCELVNQGYRTIDLPALRDILALLKDQEAVKPRYIDGKRNHFIKCGKCNTDLMRGMKYCSQCGKAVKWYE